MTGRSGEWHTLSNPDVVLIEYSHRIPNSSTYFFSPISPVDGEDALNQVELFKQRFHEYGFDFFCVFYIGPREMHLIVILLADRTDRKRP